MSRICSVFFLHRAFVVALGFVALHRVSIRTLDDLCWSKLGAGWGSRGESMLPFIGRSRRPKSARSHRNTVSSQRVNRVIFRPLVRRTACTALGCSRGDEATRQACGLQQQRPYSWPACHLLRLSADPTVEVPSLFHAVEGYGWNTRSADFGDRRCRRA